MQAIIRCCLDVSFPQAVHLGQSVCKQSSDVVGVVFVLVLVCGYVLDKVRAQSYQVLSCKQSSDVVRVVFGFGLVCGHVLDKVRAQSHQVLSGTISLSHCIDRGQSACNQSSDAVRIYLVLILLISVKACATSRHVLSGSILLLTLY